uniref:hypothetical protein n=1 Tax=Serratia proteamaculans TaxID=28151 RepID=UPI001F4C0B7F|nr:hypothetical protein [Serratia proteamaculans]ULG12096.1 SepB [Serratia entomophila]ULG12391.1 SepB [Serratia entomophila]ULG16023.1 SepB [Serratia proteamaculans]ULG18424.1 SepB [Serratia proteamaculans]ULG19599.1 SepB [Serratia proteamaculans]
MQNHQDMAITAPTLPSGGGAVTGLKGDIAAAGPDGAATLSIPLPVSPGRGYAPDDAHPRIFSGFLPSRARPVFANVTRSFGLWGTTVPHCFLRSGTLTSRLL